MCKSETVVAVGGWSCRCGRQLTGNKGNNHNAYQEEISAWWVERKGYRGGIGVVVFGFY